ncbi:hypothetical protein RB195_022600 [Necator americanus]|uniref:Uncharacterized protein n=1 Tax=Necator americanus TaxID=51031 RepID=A0ABR1EFY7_NECAM
MMKPQHDATFSITHEQNRWLGIFGGRGKNIHNDEASTRRYLLNRMNKIDGWGSLEAEGKILIMIKPQHDATFSRMNKIDGWGSLEAEGKILIMIKPQHDATTSISHKINDWGSLEAEGKIFIMMKPQHDATFSIA